MPKEQATSDVELARKIRDIAQAWAAKMSPEPALIEFTEACEKIVSDTTEFFDTCPQQDFHRGHKLYEASEPGHINNHYYHLFGRSVKRRWNEEFEQYD